MLDSNVISQILVNCLLTDQELQDDFLSCVAVRGITLNMVFNTERLKSHQDKFDTFKNFIPLEFLDKDYGESSGGGYTFLNLCLDINGNQWGEHRNVEELLLLMIASGNGDFLLPRETWQLLPGGMPYVVFYKNPIEVKTQALGDILKGLKEKEQNEHI